MIDSTLLKQNGYSDCVSYDSIPNLDGRPHSSGDISIRRASSPWRHVVLVSICIFVSAVLADVLVISFFPQSRNARTNVGLWQSSHTNKEKRHSKRRFYHVNKELRNLNKSMEGEILFRSEKSHKRFFEAWHVWSEVASSTVPPAAVVLPAHEADVALAMPVLAKISTKYATPFRIRSGGHSYVNPGSSVISDGIVLNLRHLNHMDLDPETKVATLGPNVHVDDILRTFLLPMNYSTTTGFCPNVAEGGYMGGGGWGPGHRQYGLGIDNLVEIRAVLANGEIVTASNDVNPDLFWALRGGGHSTLAVMTEFQVQLHPTTDATPFTTGTIPWQAAPSFLYNLGEMEKIGAVDGRVFLLLEGGDEVGLQMQFGYTPGDEASVHEGSRHLQDLFHTLLPPDFSAYQLVNHDIVSWTEFLTQPEQYFDGYLFRSWFGMLPPNHNTMDNWSLIIDTFVSASKLPGDDKASANPYTLYEVDLFGGKAATVSPSETAYFNRNALFNLGINVLVPANIKNAQEIFDEQVVQVDALWSALESTGMFQGKYPNYPNENDSDYAKNFWGENLARLQSIKERYDPKNIFDHAFSIPPRWTNDKRS